MLFLKVRQLNQYFPNIVTVIFGLEDFLEVVGVVNLDGAAIQVKELRALDVDQVVVLIALGQVRTEGGPAGLDVGQGSTDQRLLVVSHVPVSIPQADEVRTQASDSTQAHSPYRE